MGLGAHFIFHARSALCVGGDRFGHHVQAVGRQQLRHWTVYQLVVPPLGIETPLESLGRP